MTNWTEVKPQRDEEEEDSDIWQPKEKGDEVEGQYTEKKTDVGKYNSTLYTIGDKKVWGGTVLDARMEEISEGALVKIVYIGSKPSAHGNPYKDYTVYVSYDG